MIAAGKGLRALHLAHGHLARTERNCDWSCHILVKTPERRTRYVHSFTRTCKSLSHSEEWHMASQENLIRHGKWLKRRLGQRRFRRFQRLKKSFTCWTTTSRPTSEMASVSGSCLGQ